MAVHDEDPGSTLRAPLPAPPLPLTLPASLPGFEDFGRPYVDVDEFRAQPAPHRYVHGGFEDDDTRFSFHFPPAADYRDRFFQYITPVPGSEHETQGEFGEGDRIGFSLASGAYFIETNGGGPRAMDPFSGVDPAIGAYRANAAAASLSRVVAQDNYGRGRPFGFAFGGSGGAYRTVGGVENTADVWDGTVPFVMGSPMAIPNCFTARLHAVRVIGDRLDDVVDAMEPGGSGDPYATLDDDRLSTGFLSTGLLLPMLAEHGHADVAYRLLFQHSEPSWLTMLDRGATTVWESWDGIDEAGVARNSLNHYSKGAVIAFLHEYVAGISPLAPGYGRVGIRPRPDPLLDAASATLDTPHGRVAASWATSGGRFTLRVTVPEGVPADVTLPSGDVAQVVGGTHEFEEEIDR